MKLGNGLTRTIELGVTTLIEADKLIELLGLIGLAALCAQSLFMGNSVRRKEKR